MKQQFEEKYDKKYSVNEETGLMGFYSNLFTRNKDFGAGTRGEGEEKLVEEHKKRKDLYTKLIEDGFDKAVENNKKLEQEKEKKKQEEKNKIEKMLSAPEVKEKIIQPETPINVEDNTPISLEEKKELYKQKYLERKRKNEEKLID